MRAQTRLIALAGGAAVALMVMVSSVDITARGARWSQSEAEQRLKETARYFGVDAQGLRVTATAELNEEQYRVVRNTQLAWPDPFEPLRYVVSGETGRHGATLRAEYTPQGKLLRWDCHSCSGPPSSLTAGSVLAKLAGGHSGEFKAHEQGGANGTSRWTREEGKLSLEARITLEGGRVTNAVLDPDVHLTLARRLPFQQQVLASTFSILSITFRVVALSLAGIILLFRGIRRREWRRMGLSITLFWLALFFITWILERPGWPRDRLVFFWLARPVYWWLPCAAGLLLLRGAVIERWVGFLHAAERWRPAARTGRELWAGLLLAWPLALTPYVAGIPGGPLWNIVSPRVGFERLPALGGLLRRTSLAGDDVLYFAFIVPLLMRIRGRKWRWCLLVTCAVALFGWMGEIAPAAPAVSITAGLLFAVLLAWIYRDHGLMGALAASAATGMVTALAWLITAPGGHLLSLATSLAVYGGALAGARWLARQGSSDVDEELAEEIARRNRRDREHSARSERELLRAGFAEAREAQMGMLPEAAPRIDGYTLAAVCVPAREVGGDLYDFLEFPNGEWGLCVADVSGKGIPAALYMTMTKGVLASEGRVTADLDELARALNEPLHQAGRRKTFVTLALARLDPKTARVELIRAGHNPVLWRRKNRNETVWLQPGGLGLGLVSNQLFGKRLEHQTIEMEPGDALLLYSDGLTEAENPRVELFGEERLAEVAERTEGLDADGVIQEILKEVEIFKEGADPHDDLTLMVLKVSG